MSEVNCFIFTYPRLVANDKSSEPATGSQNCGIFHNSRLLRSSQCLSGTWEFVTLSHGLIRTNHGQISTRSMSRKSHWRDSSLGLAFLLLALAGTLTIISGSTNVGGRRGKTKFNKSFACFPFNHLMHGHPWGCALRCDFRNSGNEPRYNRLLRRQGKCDVSLVPFNDEVTFRYRLHFDDKMLALISLSGTQKIRLDQAPIILH